MAVSQIFRLKPSTIPGAGIGVFATAAIPYGAILVGLFAEGDVRRLTYDEFYALDVPEAIKENFAIQYDEECYLPLDFNRISAGWYLNNSPDNPNLGHDDDYNYFALRDIAPGEELFIRYDDL